MLLLTIVSFISLANERVLQYKVLRSTTNYLNLFGMFLICCTLLVMLLNLVFIKVLTPEIVSSISFKRGFQYDLGSSSGKEVMLRKEITSQQTIFACERRTLESLSKSFFHVIKSVQILIPIFFNQSAVLRASSLIFKAMSTGKFNRFTVKSIEILLTSEALMFLIYSDKSVMFFFTIITSQQTSEPKPIMLLSSALIFSIFYQSSALSVEFVFKDSNYAIIVFFVVSRVYFKPSLSQLMSQVLLATDLTASETACLIKPFPFNWERIALN
ncbi:transmembrane protein, putative (macronuclear) [Tetrahymena thermophila SB210]|uniref:Transmembrane protein, putative n=1 Tax=Tetrahymena thermophila (strain SB210) TaxID=312017 RepID=W7X1Z0_TETTS|nr:transmembrane protein, putative [Tetrahymena thermophila SB210]EWS73250.1 transmembrane protein, putative [Tetrahymena thermophila SB210]|eukprot:XP_012654214.1 transmembrane protein, putative [Tetrahymena thermophila SB210]